MFNDLNKAFEASLVCTVVQTELDCLRKRFQKLKQTQLPSSGDLACQNGNKTLNNEENINQFIIKTFEI